MFNLQVIGVKFNKRNQFGDFFWMCQQNEYSGSLFIFNDNEEHHDSNKRGAGNAVMRSFNKHSDYNPPKSAGIPTGTMEDGGYQNLTLDVKKTIDDSIDEIIELIKKYKFHTIYYSSEYNGILGTSIFEVDKNVLNYITDRIFNLSTNPVQIIKTLPNNYFDDFEITDNK